jgi:hypothetical protein
MPKRLSLFIVTLLLLGLFSALFPASSIAADPLPGPVQRTVDRTDVPVVSGQVKRSWTWGPYFESRTEPYKETPGGARQVYYFDKGRLEINNPAADPNNEFYATSGLLVRELITGQVQVGDIDLENREPADVVLAGDNPPLVPDAPTYASLKELVSFDGSWKASDMTGQIAGYTLKKGGLVDNTMAPFSQVKYAQYDSVTGHNIADVFLNFMNSSGPILQNGRLVNAPLYNPLYVFGRPISEAYWAKVTVAGKEQFVLVQAFERRLLTYTPQNPAEFQVEMGNLGRAYFQWRYSQAGPVPAADPATPVFNETPALALYNQTQNNMNGIKYLRLETTNNSQLAQVDEYAAPNKLRETIYGSYNGQAAYEVYVYIESREYYALFVNGKQQGQWVYVDTSTPLRWPSFSTLSPNDATVNFILGEDTKVGTEAAKSLLNTQVDLPGTTTTQNWLISAVTGVLLQRNSVSTLGNSSSTQVLRYLNYNKPIAIDAPPGAVPYQPGATSTRAGFTPFAETAGDTISPFEIFKQATRPVYAEGEIVVKFRDPQAGMQALSAGGFSAQASALDGDLAVMKFDPAVAQSALAWLKANPLVEYAEPNYLYYSEVVVEPNDGGYGQQYHLKSMKAPRAWSISTGSDVVVAVVDSGTDTSHPDLQPNVIGSFDFVDGKYPNDGPDGHGTLVAGITTAVGNNGQNGAGVAWKSKLLTFRVLGVDGGRATDVARGVREATDKGAKVINMSLGSSSNSQTLSDAVKYAIGKGVIVIAAAGNQSSNRTYYPASYPGVISVAATGKQGLPASFSNYGSTITVTAPGVGICGTIRLNQFGCSQGTSFSSPAVAGVVTLMLSVNPYLTRDQVKAILIATATPAPGKQVGQFDERYGYGSVNAFLAVRAAATNQYFLLPQGIRE